MVKGLFGSKPKATAPLPDPPPPPAVPELGAEAGEEEAKRVKRRAGFQQAVSVTGALRPRSTGRKTLLG